jgi:plastocyanin
VSSRTARRSLATLLVLAGLVAGACGGGGDDAASSSGDGGKKATAGPPAAAPVKLEAAQFDPAQVTVQVGDTVRWEWGGNVQHDVVGGSFKSPIKSKGDFTHTFTTAGTFPFHCDVHPTMKGTVTVQP